MKPLIYLHIGHIKTGTSSLQHYLCNNYDALASDKILYPKSPLYGPAHHKLAFPFDLGYARDYPKEDKNIVYNELKNEILNSGCNKIILSSEYFVFLRDLSQLPDFFKNYDFKIIIYLRDQRDWLESFYKQILSSYAYRVKSFEEYINTLPKYFIQYENLLKPWQNFFGESNVKVISYDIAKNKINGVISDFCDELGLTLPSESMTLDKAQLNLSLDVNDVLFLESIQSLNLDKKTYDCIIHSLKSIRKTKEKKNIVFNDKEQTLINEYLKDTRYQLPKSLSQNTDCLRNSDSSQDQLQNIEALILSLLKIYLNLKENENL